MKGRGGWIAILAWAMLTACSQQSESPLRVGTNIWPGYEYFYLARSLGYYDGTPIKLVEFPSASEVIRAYRNGLVEAAGLTMDETLLLADHGKQPRVILITDFSNGADVILGQPGITSLAQLAGKRVAVESTALGAFVLARACQKSGLRVEDLEIVPMAVMEHERAFQRRQVDAVVTFEPVRTKLLKAGATLLFDSSQIPNEILDVLTVSADVLNSHPRALKALLEGWFRARDYAQAHPEDAADRAAQREGVSSQEFLESLQGLDIPDLQENRVLLGSPEEGLAPGLRALAGMMKEQRLLERSIDPVPLISDHVVRQLD